MSISRLAAAIWLRRIIFYREPSEGWVLRYPARNDSRIKTWNTRPYSGKCTENWVIEWSIVQPAMEVIWMKLYYMFNGNVLFFQ